MQQRHAVGTWSFKQTENINKIISEYVLGNKRESTISLKRFTRTGPKSHEFHLCGFKNSHRHN